MQLKRGQNLFGDGVIGAFDVFPGSLGNFDVGVHTRVMAFYIEVVHERHQAGCFTGLARSMEDEIPFLMNQIKNFIHIPAAKRGYLVVPDIR